MQPSQGKSGRNDGVKATYDFVNIYSFIKMQNTYNGDFGFESLFL
jgi:hypothetical protein